jgi:multidrug efflux pump subunit AcrB
MARNHRRDLVGLFARHRVAANLLMLMMILAGVWALTNMNVQFFPSFNMDIATVRVVWSGASAEDVETAITVPLEQELRALENVRRSSSTSATGVSSVTLQFREGTDMATAMDQLKELVARVRNLPDTAEAPEINRASHFDNIARLLLTGPADLTELRHLAQRMRDELLARGVGKVTITGLPEEEMAIEVPSARLHELELSLEQVAQRVRGLSSDIPGGSAGRADVARQLRTLDQRRTELGFEGLALIADERGRLITLGDIARIERRPREGGIEVRHNGKPAVELLLERAEAANALHAARILTDWLEETRPILPPGVQLIVFDESWTLIRDRINLLVKNGIGGLLLVIGVLFLFLNGRVAFWVMVGIPVAFMATLAVLYGFGGSINMISLFALIMALGIIVDDAIVVGEDAMTHYQAGAGPLEAAEGGARRMLAPVFASTLTTVAAFLPLMLVSGPIGLIMFSIPLVMVAILIASLIESFLVLPGHLRQSFQNARHREPTALRARLDAGFAAFRDRAFRPVVTAAVHNSWTTLSVAVALLILSVGLVAGGRIAFTFFPTAEGTILYANVTFTPGSPSSRVEAFLTHLEETLHQADAELGGGLVTASTLRVGMGVMAGGGGGQRGQHLGSAMVELLEPDHREVRNREFIAAWKARIQHPPGLERLTISERTGGPPGRDVDIRLTGADPLRLKAAADELGRALERYVGVSAIEDDMPWGQEQLIYRLTPQAKVLGLTTEDVGRQLRAAFDGHLAQIFQDGQDEVEVRVMLPDSERHQLATLERLRLSLPGGGSLALANVAEVENQRGFEVLRHAEGQLAISVSAEVDRQRNNANRILASLDETFLPALAQRHGIGYSFEGRAADQAETLGDMRRGLLFALGMIYLVLAWVFSSYARPLVVMSAIPFAVIGALTGHWLLGIDLTILSLFGLFGLTGIVVNDSIILVSFYRHLRASGMRVQEAIVEAACQRLRAVLLTSMTTIAGLLPLLFERSLQAQFLIPMAVSITFGLGVATLLVLFFIPALLSLIERATERWYAAHTPAKA